MNWFYMFNVLQVGISQKYMHQLCINAILECYCFYDNVHVDMSVMFIQHSTCFYITCNVSITHTNFI